jgi:hypothetical protein
MDVGYPAFQVGYTQVQYNNAVVNPIAFIPVVCRLASCARTPCAPPTAHTKCLVKRQRAIHTRTHTHTRLRVPLHSGGGGGSSGGGGSGGGGGGGSCLLHLSASALLFLSCLGFVLTAADAQTLTRRAHARGVPVQVSIEGVHGHIDCNVSMLVVDYCRAPCARVACPLHAH